MCHKEVDPSVVTQPSVTLTSEMIVVYAASRQLTATKLHRGIRIEQIRVGILPFPRPPVDTVAGRSVMR